MIDALDCFDDEHELENGDHLMTYIIWIEIDHLANEGLDTCCLPPRF